MNLYVVSITHVLLHNVQISLAKGDLALLPSGPKTNLFTLFQRESGCLLFFFKFNLVALKAISLSVFLYLLLRDSMFFFQPKLYEARTKCCRPLPSHPWRFFFN